MDESKHDGWPELSQRLPVASPPHTACAPAPQGSGGGGVFVGTTQSHKPTRTRTHAHHRDDIGRRLDESRSGDDDDDATYGTAHRIAVARPIARQLAPLWK